MNTPTLSKKAGVVSWIGQIVVALILGQVLFFKFIGAEESRALFELLGAEPWGRIGSGAAELIAVVLIIRPKTAALGALATMALMAGAIGSHLTVLGVEVNGDGGALFGMAIVSFLAASVVAVIRSERLLPLRTARVRRSKS